MVWTDGKIFSISLGRMPINLVLKKKNVAGTPQIKVSINTFGFKYGTEK